MNITSLNVYNVYMCMYNVYSAIFEVVKNLMLT